MSKRQNPSKPQTSLVEFFRTSPLVEVELDLTRSRDPEVIVEDFGTVEYHATYDYKKQRRGV